MMQADIAPQNIEAEKSILGACLQFPDVVPEAISRLRIPDHFYLPTHRAVFAAIIELSNRNLPPDLRRLASFFLKMKAGSL
jgi:replicative DNA helicase